MTASDYVPTSPNLPLASEGASTDAGHLTATCAHSTQWFRLKAEIRVTYPRSEANASGLGENEQREPGAEHVMQPLAVFARQRNGWKHRARCHALLAGRGVINNNRGCRKRWAELCRGLMSGRAQACVSARLSTVSRMILKPSVGGDMNQVLFAALAKFSSVAMRRSSV